MTTDEQPNTRATIIAFGLVIFAIVIGSVLLLLTRPAPVEITINPPAPTATSPPTATPAPILVYVTGAVNEPESTVSLPRESRVQDAIEAAGGITDTADLTRVNLADLLRDGVQVHVPSLEIEEEVGAGIVETTLPDTTLATPITEAAVSINTADVAALSTLPGIGEVTAQNIIAYREENGPFASLEDLGNVSGIGPATLENVAERVTFD